MVNAADHIELVSVSAAARVLAVAENTVRLWTRRGLLPCQRLTNGTRLFRPESNGCAPSGRAPDVAPSDPRPFEHEVLERLAELEAAAVATAPFTCRELDVLSVEELQQLETIVAKLEHARRQRHATCAGDLGPRAV